MPGADVGGCPPRHPSPAAPAKGPWFHYARQRFKRLGSRRPLDCILRELHVRGMTPALRCRYSGTTTAIGLQPLVCGAPTIPRTAGRFVLVRYARLCEQTTSLSRTASLSGAFPDFTAPNPLSGWLLIVTCSARFQEFQALRALAGSDSPYALAGIYTLLLQTTHWTSRRDPVHPLLLCTPCHRFESVSCVPVVYDACAPRLTQSDYVKAFRRASLHDEEVARRRTGSTVISHIKSSHRRTRSVVTGLRPIE